jgi:Predicted SAM-dependent methyltransferase
MGQMNALLLYCRAGFEKECAAEIMANAAQLGVHGYVKAAEGSAWVLFQAQSADEIELLTTHLPFYKQFSHASGFVLRLCWKICPKATA